MTVRPRRLRNPRTQCGANRTPRFTGHQSAARKQQRGEMIRPAVRENKTPRYLAARELRQVGFEVLANHRVDGNQTEHAGLANAALRVVIALQGERAGSIRRGAHAGVHARTHWPGVSGNVGGVAPRVQSTRKHFQGQIRQISPTVQISTMSKYASLEPTLLLLYAANRLD